MKRRTFLQRSAALAPILAELSSPALNIAQEPPPLALPRPRRQGGKPLMQALAERQTNRNIAEEKLPAQTLSDLLWAAFGVNREAGGLRTAPSAMAVREIDIYVFLPEGVYLFDAPAHSLKPVLAGDQRARTGNQAGVGKAPVSLVYVADLNKYASGSGPMRVTDVAVQTAWSNAHAGFIGQNVYLYAASEGLACWFRALIDNAGIAKLLSLRPGQKVLYSQGVGKPEKAA
jgi:nitroreductase